MTTPVWISLGSNLGDRRAILDAAVRSLGQTEGVVVSRVSSYHETSPVGGPPGQGPFLNAAARLDTSLSPLELLAATQAVENEFGRVRTVRWGERTLDLDLLIYGSRFLDHPDLKLPHPRLAFRRFVLEPLVEIAPTIVDAMTRRSVADLLANLDRRPRILMIDEALAALSGNLPDRIAAELSGIALTTNWTEPSSRPDGTALGLDRRIVIARKTETMQAAELAVLSNQYPWVVFDFVLDVPLIREQFSMASVDDPGEEVQLARVALNNSDVGMTLRIAKIINEVPAATLIVEAANSILPRKPGGSRTPIYQPEANNLDAIVAEVAAICRGIEAG